MGPVPTAMRWHYAYFYVAGRMLPTAASTQKNVVVTLMALKVVYVNLSKHKIIKNLVNMVEISTAPTILAAADTDAVTRAAATMLAAVAVRPQRQ